MNAFTSPASLVRCVRHRGARQSLLAVFLSSMAISSLSALTVTNVLPVNVTPSGFSVVFTTSEPAASGLSVYADEGGLTNLAGQVGIEPLPLHTGNPTVIEPYQRRQNLALIRQKTKEAGLGHARVTGCRSGTAYYYRVRATGTNGQETVWPVSGPLPSVTTASETAFVTEAKQLIVDLPGGDVEGQIVTLSHVNAAHPLVAVAGDGAGTNQVIFTLSDLMTLVGGTNFIPVGSQQFDVQIFAQAGGGSSSYTLDFTSQFAVAALSSVSYGDTFILGLGSAVLRAGDSGSVPVSLGSSGGLATVSFAFDMPSGHLTNLAIQTLSPALQTATIQQSSATRWQVTLATQPGQTLSGTQQVAQINFTTPAGQSSAFVPLQIAAIDGRHGDNSPFALQFVQNGRVIVIAEEPLLEAQLAPDGSRSLILYGKPGASYQIQAANSVGIGDNWNDWTLVSLTNLSQAISAVNPPWPVAFFRAYQIQPPRLEILLSSGGQPVVMLHGRPGASYQVQIATRLTGGGNWTNWARVPLTGTSQIVPGTIPPGGAFVRAYEFVADPSLLDAQLTANGARNLVLYGKSGSSYQIQMTGDLSDGSNWTNWLRVPLTNSFQIVTGTAPPSPTGIFFRAKEFVADPPLLDARLEGIGAGLLALYGQSGAAYQLQYTTNLSGVVTWYPQLNYTLTRSFQFVNGLNPTNPLIIYRVVKP